MSTIVFICYVVILGVITRNGWAKPLLVGAILLVLHLTIEGVHRYLARKHAPLTPREAEYRRLLKEEQRAASQLMARITKELGTWTGSWEDAVKQRLREWRRDHEPKK